MSQLQPDLPNQPLADQSWFQEFLAANGFTRSSPTTFVRGPTSDEFPANAPMADRPEAVRAGAEFALQPGPDLVPAPAQTPTIDVRRIPASLPADPGARPGELPEIRVTGAQVKGV